MIKAYPCRSNTLACRLGTQPPLQVRQSSLKSGMVTDSVKSDEPCIGLLVRQFSFVFFGMFELTSVSFGIDLNLVAKGMAELP